MERKYKMRFFKNFRFWKNNLSFQIIFGLVFFLNIGIINLSADEAAVSSTEEPTPESSNITNRSNSMERFMEANKKIEEAVVAGYKVIENGVVTGYKAIENGVVTGYKRIERWFTETFHITNPNQSPQQTNSPDENTASESLPYSQ